MLFCSAREDFLYIHALTCCLGVYTPLIYLMNRRDGRSYVTHTSLRNQHTMSIPPRNAPYPTRTWCALPCASCMAKKKKDFAYVGKPWANTSKHLLGQTLLLGVRAPMYERVDWESCQIWSWNMAFVALLMEYCMIEFIEHYILRT